MNKEVISKDIRNKAGELRELMFIYWRQHDGKNVCAPQGGFRKHKYQRLYDAACEVENDK